MVCCRAMLWCCAVTLCCHAMLSRWALPLPSSLVFVLASSTKNHWEITHPFLPHNANANSSGASWSKHELWHAWGVMVMVYKAFNTFCGIITAFVRFLNASSRYANARSFFIYSSITVKCERLQGWQVVLLSEPKKNQNMKIIFSFTDVWTTFLTFGSANEKREHWSRDALCR